MQNAKHVVSLYGHLITIMRFFLVKTIDCVKDMIQLNCWQNLAGVTDVKTSSFGKMCNALWMIQFNWKFQETTIGQDCRPIHDQLNC